MDEFDKTEATPEAMDGGIRLSPPWVEFANEVKALFEQDPEIAVEWDDGTMTLTILVDDDVKADALTQLMPAERTFGNVTAKVEVIPANTDVPRVNLFRRAFDGNPALSFTDTVDTVLGTFSYVVFKPEVVQYFNDDLSDYHGYRSTLYEDIARNVFEGDVIRFCTDVVE